MDLASVKLAQSGKMCPGTWGNDLIFVVIPHAAKQYRSAPSQSGARNVQETLAAVETTRPDQSHDFVNVTHIQPLADLSMHVPI